jgi:putative transposase
VGVPKYRINLTQEERDILKKISQKDTAKQSMARRARIILMSDEGLLNQEISAKLDIMNCVVTKWTKRWHERASDPVEERLQDLPRPGTPDTIMPEQWCNIIAMSCEKPEDHGLPTTDWTYRELAGEVIKQEIVETISPSHLGRILKKKTSSPTEFATG